MNDPASRNTDVRPDLWRDPSEQQEEPSDEQRQQHAEVTEITADHVTPYSTGAEDMMMAGSDTSTLR